MKLCAAPGCNVGTSRTVLMCRTHWYQVPPELRALVMTTWRRFWGGDWAAFDAYQAARTAAIESVTP